MTNFGTVQLILDILTTLATFVAVAVAIWGLSSWRKELRGTSQYQVANRVKLAVLKIEMAIAAARSIAMFGSGNESPQDISEHQHAEYARRWEQVSDAYAELRLANLEAKVYLDPKIQPGIEALMEKVGVLKLEISHYLSELRGRSLYPDLETRDRSLRIVFGTGKSDDEFGREVNELVSRVFEQMRRY
jgi:hypothetical protein